MTRSRLHTATLVAPSVPTATRSSPGGAQARRFEPRRDHRGERHRRRGDRCVRPRVSQPDRGQPVRRRHRRVAPRRRLRNLMTGTFAMTADLHLPFVPFSSQEIGEESAGRLVAINASAFPVSPTALIAPRAAGLGEGIGDRPPPPQRAPPHTRVLGASLRSWPTDSRSRERCRRPPAPLHPSQSQHRFATAGRRCYGPATGVVGSQSSRRKGVRLRVLRYHAGAGRRRAGRGGLAPRSGPGLGTVRR